MTNMTNRELLCKIKNLEKVEPTDAWINSTRSFILDYARIQEKNEKSFLFQESDLGIKEKINSAASFFRQRFALQAASFAVVLIMAGTVVTAKASESLPGENLYPVKLWMEKAELALTFNEDKRIALKFELAERRLNEFSALVESGKVAKENNPEAVDVAMESFKNQLNAAVNDLDSAAKIGPNSNKVMAVAKMADSKTADYAKKIEKAKVTMGDKTDSKSKGKVNDVINKIEEVNISALSVLASASKQSGDSQTASDSKEIADKVGEKIKNAEEKAKLIEEKVLAVMTDKDGAVLESGNNSAAKLLEEAKGVLLEAKADLAGNDPGKALEKIIVSNEITKTAEKIADAAIAENDAKTAASQAAATEPSPSPSLIPATSQSPSPAISPSATPVSNSSPAPQISPSPTPTSSIAPAVPSPSATPTATASPKL